MNNQTTTDPNITYVVYETTNTVTNETYGGVFSFEDTKKGVYKYENYIGGGITYDGQAAKMKQTEFTKNVTAYGYDSFIRKDLYHTSSEAIAYRKEAELVNEQYVDNPFTLNQQTGGKQGKRSEASKKRRSVASTGGNNPAAKAVKNIKTGKVYSCIKEAAEKLGINYSTLRKQLQYQKNPNLITL